MKIPILSRRSFLKAAMVGTMLLLARPSFASEMIEEEKMAEGRLLLYHTRTGEKLDVTYRDSGGKYDEGALSAINHILRCHQNDEEIDMDVRVIEYLNSVDKSLGGDNLIHVISGYRSKEYNEMLRRRSRRVARHSLHLTGQAVDLRIPGVSLKNIKKTAMNMRFGGVGYYPRANFVHLDSGSFRYW